jgi:CDP-diacylglycerol--glycerol-3-phosphate 3-phosphatidyltransferase
MKRIPFALVVLRAIAGPALVVAAIARMSGFSLATILVLAFLSDVFDGIVARKLGVATERLRSADSIVDTFFYIAAVIALWLYAPNVLIANTTGILIIIVLEVARQVLERMKYGRMAAYHFWSAKAWGVMLAFGFAEAFLTGTTGPLFRAAIIVGIVADTEGLIASMILSRWHHDIPHIWRAVAIQKSEASQD